jgi:hypothetical protein
MQLFILTSLLLACLTNAIAQWRPPPTKNLCFSPGAPAGTTTAAPVPSRTCSRATTVADAARIASLAASGFLATIPRVRRGPIAAGRELAILSCSGRSKMLDLARPTHRSANAWEGSRYGQCNCVWRQTTQRTPVQGAESNKLHVYKDVYSTPASIRFYDLNTLTVQ